MRRLLLLSLLCSSAMASQLDSKSLLTGVGIGLGVYATRSVIAIPVAKATKRAAKKTARGTVHVLTLGRR